VLALNHAALISLVTHASQQQLSCLITSMFQKELESSAMCTQEDYPVQFKTTYYKNEK